MAPLRLPVSANVLPENRTHFRVWAPSQKAVAVVLGDGRVTPLSREEGGFFSGAVNDVGAGATYRYRLSQGDFPDPASRFQPEGPHGPSRVVAPSQFAWTDSAWRGIERQGQVLYEMHVGTFGGTWSAAREHLPHLADLGITAIELMPVADFPGRYGWGYDGVDLFAPTRLYGEPDDFRAFVNAAHERGLGVILDVVYNHVGPDGNYLKEFSRDYFTDRYRNEWGEPLNFDGPNSGPVREFFIANAAHWISEYHLDGLRLDATQQIFDASPTPILREIGDAVRAAGGERATYLVAENEPQDANLVRPPEQGGTGLDALWNDDFHHEVIVALSGKRDAYYSDYHGTAREFVALVRHGFLYQGQRCAGQGKPRGGPSWDLDPARFVTYLQNHDQIANSLRGRRVHAWSNPASLRVMTALLLLGPGTPMLFQGQEFAASTPFLYFADHNPDLARLVAEGRRKFLRQFSNFAAPGAEKLLLDPENEETFRHCVLDFADIARNPEAVALHRDLIHLRRGDPVVLGAQRTGLDAATLAEQAFLLRFFGADDDDRLILFNLGPHLRLEPAPEPLLAPPSGRRWRQCWCSEDVRYGGDGMATLDGEPWTLPGCTAVLLRAERKS